MSKFIHVQSPPPLASSVARAKPIAGVKRRRDAETPATTRAIGLLELEVKTWRNENLEYAPIGAYKELIGSLIRERLPAMFKTNPSTDSLVEVCDLLLPLANTIRGYDDEAQRLDATYAYVKLAMMFEMEFHIKRMLSVLHPVATKTTTDSKTSSGSAGGSAVVATSPPRATVVPARASGSIPAPAASASATVASSIPSPLSVSVTLPSGTAAFTFVPTTTTTTSAMPAFKFDFTAPDPLSASLLSFQVMQPAPTASSSTKATATAPAIAVAPAAAVAVVDASADKGSCLFPLRTLVGYDNEDNNEHHQPGSALFASPVKVFKASSPADDAAMEGDDGDCENFPT